MNVPGLSKDDRLHATLLVINEIFRIADSAYEKSRVRVSVANSTDILRQRAKGWSCDVLVVLGNSEHSQMLSTGCWNPDS